MLIEKLVVFSSFFFCFHFVRKNLSCIIQEPKRERESSHWEEESKKRNSNSSYEDVTNTRWFAKSVRAYTSSTIIIRCNFCRALNHKYSCRGLTDGKATSVKARKRNIYIQLSLGNYWKLPDKSQPLKRVPTLVKSSLKPAYVLRFALFSRWYISEAEKGQPANFESARPNIYCSFFPNIFSHFDTYILSLR